MSAASAAILARQRPRAGERDRAGGDPLRRGRLRLDLPDGEATGPTDPAAPAAAPGGRPATEAERRARDRAEIVAALSLAGGRVSGPGGAAELLGLRPTTLASRIKAHGIPRG